MLYLIGLGLNDINDISLKSLGIIKGADRIYLECYTSIINSTVAELEELYGKKVFLADRYLLENTYTLIEESEREKIVLLVPGSPLFATTHTDLLMRCKEKGIECVIVDNTSIYNVVGRCGLFSYSFGRTVSIPFFTESFKPLSVYDKILENIKNNLHTLCLLDIKIERGYYEQDGGNSRFMSANVAIQQILESEDLNKSGVITEKTKIFVICRFGCNDESFYYDEMGKLLEIEFGKPLHSLIIPAKMEVVEEEHVRNFFT